MWSSFNSCVLWHLYMRSAWPTSLQSVTTIILHWYRIKDENKGRVEESDQMEKTCSSFTTCWTSFALLNDNYALAIFIKLKKKKWCFIFLHLMMNNVKSFHVRNWKLILWIWIFRYLNNWLWVTSYLVCCPTNFWIGSNKEKGLDEKNIIFQKGDVS